MNVLSAINICLAALGEELAASRDENDYYVGLCEGAIDRGRRRILLEGYHFNTDRKTFSPDINGEIELASDEFGIAFPKPLDATLTLRGGKVWDRQNRVFYGSEFEGLSCLDLSFENLPEVFAEWIAREAAVEIVMQVDGATAELSLARQMANRAEAAALNSEGYSMYSLSGFGRVVAAHGL